MNRIATNIKKKIRKMENYGVIIFLIKYLVCTILLIDLYKQNRLKRLIQAIIITFSALSINILVNYFLSLNKENLNQFYYINFIDFISITLIVNLLISKKGPHNNH